MAAVQLGTWVQLGVRQEAGFPYARTDRLGPMYCQQQRAQQLQPLGGWSLHIIFTHFE